ncbi:hypothetical protein BH11BAC2_BH11BAC2_14180 [soil metagenome]
MSTGKIIVGLVAGASLGAVIAVLFAPDKGVNTRKKIKQVGEDYFHDFTNKIEDVLLSATNEFEYVKSEAENLLEKGKEKVEKSKNDIQNLVGHKV